MNDKNRRSNETILIILLMTDFNYLIRVILKFNFPA